MNNHQILPDRRSIRLKNYDYSSSGLYFVTICCHQWESRFGKIVDGKMVLNEFGKIASRAWFELNDRFECFESNTFQLMPNHLHAIFCLDSYSCCGNSIMEIPAVGDILGAYKSIVSNECLNIYQRKGLRMGRFWQRNYFEHVIRSERGYQNIANYIISNPSKWEGSDVRIDLEFLRRIEAM